MSDLMQLLNMLFSLVSSVSIYSYAVLNLILLIIVSMNLKICRWMWMLMASLAGQVMIQTLYIYMFQFGGRTAMGSSLGSSYMGSLQLLGMVLHTLEVTSIAGLIFSYRHKFHAYSTIDHSAWTQP